MRLLLLADLNEASTSKSGEAGSSEIGVRKVGEALSVEGILYVFEGKGIVYDASLRFYDVRYETRIWV